MIQIKYFHIYGLLAITCKDDDDDNDDDDDADIDVDVSSP